MWNKYKGLIFVISGPSGSGKTTLVHKLLKDKELRHRLCRSVSFTTRKSRSREIQGRDYFFISEEEFKRNLRQKKLLEWTRYLGYYYGTSKDYVQEALKQGRSLALCLDLKGALKIKQLFPGNTRLIFVMPPSVSELKTRIESRCNKTKKAEVLKRLKLAKQELASCARYDYCIVNKNLTKAESAIKRIVRSQLRMCPHTRRSNDC